jgi:glycosyltransferase involved in cell wall biosynthesis
MVHSSDVSRIRGTDIIVAIPIHNEAALIAQCLMALATQTYGSAFTVVAYLNNCTDMTGELIRRLRAKVPYTLRIFDERLPRDQANAGMARRIALQRAASLASPDAILLTTDADSRVSGNWISANIAAMAAGADAVAGMVELEAADAAALPRRLIDDELACDEFAAMLDEIDSTLDPDPFDPWPRHTQHSGASIAVRAAWHHRVGGIPPVPVAEDRQFFAELRRADARIRHAPEVIVTTSGRTVGRAKGGMADTIARRLEHPDQWLDNALEPAHDRLMRAMLRSVLRDIWSNPVMSATRADEIRQVATTLMLPAQTVDRALRSRTFGLAWAHLENSSPALRYRLVSTQTLQNELAMARHILNSVREHRNISARGYRSDNPMCVDGGFDAVPAASAQRSDPPPAHLSVGLRPRQAS